MKYLNPEKKYQSWGLLIFGLVVWLIMFTLGLEGYAGSKLAYVMFSIVTGALIVTGLRPGTSYGYMFLTIFLWLGFWLKMTIHIILSYPFIEPVGTFVGGSEAWDGVLYAASAASMGVMLGKILFNLKSSRVSVPCGVVKSTPPWYSKSRKWLWTSLIITGIVISIINLKYGMHQIGLPARTILISPLNAVVAWFLNIGLATGIAVLLWWDIVLKKNIGVKIYTIVFEAFFSSVSILSRGLYVFHALPQFWAIYRLKHGLNGLSRTKGVLLAVVFGFFLVLTISSTTTMRNYYYQTGEYSSTAYQQAYARWEVSSATIDVLRAKLAHYPPEEREGLLRRINELLLEKLKSEKILAEERSKLLEFQQSDFTQSRVLLNEFGYQMTGGFMTRVMYLGVDRWIGLEGLMAVQSYPEKSWRLLWSALSEKPQVGNPDIYQAVSNSIYLKSDGTKFRFASLPGAAAFLYYSNSLLMVMFGMFCLTLVVLSVEYFINAMTTNPILCSLYGVVMANNVVQFGVAPRSSLPYLFVLTSGILLVCIIHTSFFTLLLRKLKLFKTAPNDE